MMTGSLIVAVSGAVAAAAATGVLAARCARTPRLFLIAWTVAVFALAVALATQAVGYLSGFSDLMFRTVEIGAQALAPLALCVGLVEIVGRSIVSRFAMRLAAAAIGVVVLVIMIYDPLSANVTLSTSWPNPAVVYQLVPGGLIEIVAAFTVLTALGSLFAAGVRSRRGPGYAAFVRPVLAGAGAAIVVALPGVGMLAGHSLGGTGSGLAQLAAAGLIWYAVVAAGRARLIEQPESAGRDAPARQYDPDGEDWSEPLARVGAGYRDHEGSGNPSGSGYDDSPYDDYGGPAHGGSAGGVGHADDDAENGYASSGYPRDGYAAQDAGIGNPALAALAAEPDRSGGEPRGGYDGRGFDPVIHTGAIDPYMPGLADGLSGGASGGNGRSGRDAAPKGPLFGQITIYTVLDERVDDFDQMIERVVEQVRANEPGTLVYIAHAVPTAPMQRILYEVYQDRASYDDHLHQPYVAKFETERRAMVLATNSIELGLQQAKVSPLPSYSAISDILSESGIDLTGVTEGGRKGAPGTGSPASYARSVPPELPSAGTGGHHLDQAEQSPWPSGQEGRYR